MSVRIEYSNKTLSWNAMCPNCKKCVVMVTEEAIRLAPRRESGSSILLPVTMTAQHECPCDPR